MDEWEKYELHHRKRLAIKPGLTGMWQVSGRSDITDFEEVVELDTKYIVYNNEVLFVMPHGDETYMSHTAVPVGHYVPLDCDENIYKQTEEAVKNAIKALGLNNCAVNVAFCLAF